MRRSIFHDKTNATYTETGKMSFRKMRNDCLNSKLCAKRKLLHSDENAHVFFVKETLKFVIKL